MDTNSERKRKEELEERGGGNLPLAKEVYEIVDCAFEVLNEMGHGGKEKLYERALGVEFSMRGIDWESQKRFPAIYKGTKVGELVPDMIVFGSVIVETKVVAQLGAFERGQVINYLRITGLRVGVLLNFMKPTLEWERIVV